MAINDANRVAGFLAIALNHVVFPQRERPTLTTQNATMTWMCRCNQRRPKNLSFVNGSPRLTHIGPGTNRVMAGRSNRIAVSACIGPG